MLTRPISAEQMRKKATYSCQFAKADGSHCKRRAARGEPHCWQHACGWRARLRSLTHRQATGFLLAAVTLLLSFGLGIPSLYLSYRSARPETQIPAVLTYRVLGMKEWPKEEPNSRFHTLVRIRTTAALSRPTLAVSCDRRIESIGFIVSKAGFPEADPGGWPVVGSSIGGSSRGGPSNDDRSFTFWVTGPDPITADSTVDVELSTASRPSSIVVYEIVGPPPAGVIKLNEEH